MWDSVRDATEDFPNLSASLVSKLVKHQLTILVLRAMPFFWIIQEFYLNKTRKAKISEREAWTHEKNQQAAEPVDSVA